MIVRRRFKFVVPVVLVILLVLWGVSWGAARWLIVGDDLKSPADAIVVLSGSTAFRERTELAAQLFKEGFGSTVILTNDGQQGGWSNEKERNPFTFESATDSLVRAGVSANKIEVIGPVVSSTHDEALAIKSWAESRQKRSIIVVTSAYHGRRAEWTFQRVVGTSPKVQWVFVPPGQQTPREWEWWIYPRGWRTVALEYLKIGYYRLRY